MKTTELEIKVNKETGEVIFIQPQVYDDESETIYITVDMVDMICTELQKIKNELKMGGEN